MYGTFATNPTQKRKRLGTINSRPQFDPLIGTFANSVRFRKIKTAAIGKTNIPCFHSSEAFHSVRSRRQRGSEPRPYPLAYGKRSIAATTITLTAAAKVHASLRSATRGFIRRKLDYILARHGWIVTISLLERWLLSIEQVFRPVPD